jgi:hypothetical protein
MRLTVVFAASTNSDPFPCVAGAGVDDNEPHDPIARRCPASTEGGDNPMINSGDTSWVLMATTLVFFMMPGLALFCGGLVGEKNVIATMAQSYVAIGVVSLLWVVLGYSLAFGNDHWGIIGGFSNVNGRLVAPRCRDSPRSC